MQGPTEEQLAKIKDWPVNDLCGLMDYIEPLWEYSDCGYWEHQYHDDGHEEYHIHTAGWSDNEQIIRCMEANFIWWAMYWYQSTRGGHYIFKTMVLK
jgi:hypothetical protein